MMTDNVLDKNATIKNLNTRFKELCFCGTAVALLMGGIFTYNIASGPGQASEFDVDWAKIMDTALSFLYLGFYICAARLCYRAWERIPGNIARTTPGKAAWLLFVPVFNFFWIFVAFWGLAKDMNMTLAGQQGNQYRVNEFTGLAVCVLPLLGLVFNLFSGVAEGLEMPFLPTVGQAVATVIGILQCVVWILFFKSIKKGTISLLN